MATQAALSSIQLERDVGGTCGGVFGRWVWWVCRMDVRSGWTEDGGTMGLGEDASRLGLMLASPALGMLVPVFGT